MANYPGAYYAPRDKENKSGIVYDAAKKTIVFVEDFDSLENEIKAVEEELGLNLNHIGPGNDTGLVLYLPFDENEGVVAGDKSHYSNDGDFIGAGEPAWSEGHKNTAVDFDGINDSIICPATASLNTLTALSVLCWVYRNASDGRETIIYKSSANAGYHLGIETNNKLNLNLPDAGGNNQYQSTRTIPSGEWVHIAVVADGTNVNFYINGESSGSPAQTVSPIVDHSAITMKIGWLTNSHAWNLIGKLDELRVYNRALSIDEVKMHYFRS